MDEVLKMDDNKISNNNGTELDKVPVKLNKEEIRFGGGDENEANEELPPITEKEIHYILKCKSQELQTDSSFESFDSNVKIFKTTIQEIFDRFYTNMNDFEYYKQRFQEIVARNQEEDVDKMEDFIKDVIQNITSEKSVKENQLSNEESEDKNIISMNTSSETRTYTINSLASSEFNPNCNIYLLSNAPYVQIKMNNRHMLSEININSANSLSNCKTEKNVISTENFQKIAEKESELEKYASGDNLESKIDKEIPIKNTSARNNIFQDENESRRNNNNTENYSIIYRLCKYFCKKLKKN